MGAVSTAVGVVGGLIVLGVAMNGGPAMNPDGSVNLQETVDQGAHTGFETAGDAIASGTEGAMTGTVDAVLESDLAKAGLVIGGGVAVGRAVVSIAPHFRPKEPVAEPTGGWVCDEGAGKGTPCEVDDDEVVDGELVDDFVLDDIPQLEGGVYTVPGYVID